MRSSSGAGALIRHLRSSFIKGGPNPSVGDQLPLEASRSPKLAKAASGSLSPPLVLQRWISETQVPSMNWGLAAANWEHYRGRVKARWSGLSEHQLDEIRGDRLLLAQVLREAYTVTSDEAERQIQAFEIRNCDYRPATSTCSKWRIVDARLAVSAQAAH